MGNEVIYQRYGPLVLTGLVALVLFVEYFVGYKPAVDASQTVTFWSTTIGLFGSLLGAVSLIIINAKNLTKKTTNIRIYAGITLVTLFGFLLIGLIYSSTSVIYTTLYNNVNVVLGSAMMGVLGFYFIMGAYRSFKLNTLESAAFIFSLIIILFMSAPIGSAIWPGIDTIGLWIQNVPNKAATRGILICVALGTIILAYRTLLGREKSYLGE